MLLTFELTPDGEELEIHCDSQGISRLLASLSRTAESRTHDHLMTPSWGGHELTEAKQGKENRLLNKVTIRYWPQL